MIWDLEEKYINSPSAGYSKKISLGKWKVETENDIYLTEPITYQTESTILYKITDKVGIGVLGNYLEALEGRDYSAKIVLTIRLNNETK